MLAAAVVVACGLYTPCDLPPPVKHPAPHVTVTKSKSAPTPVAKPIAPATPVDVMPRPAAEDFRPAPTLKETPKFTPTTQNTAKGKTMLEQVASVYKWVADLSWPALVLAAGVLYYTVRHGWPWVQAKATSIFNSFKTDISALEARVSLLEQVTRAAPAPVAGSPVVAPIPAPAA